MNINNQIAASFSDLVDPNSKKGKKLRQKKKKEEEKILKLKTESKNDE